jgi:hypothetical protein
MSENNQNTQQAEQDGQAEQDDFLKSLNIKIDSLSLEERQEIFNMVNNQLQSVVMETMIGSMNPNQIQRFKEAVEKGGVELEEETEKIAAEIPGLKEKMEQAVAGEMATIKAGKAQLDEAIKQN